jgi:hypothetical protein
MIRSARKSILEFSIIAYNIDIAPGPHLQWPQFRLKNTCEVFSKIL